METKIAAELVEIARELVSGGKPPRSVYKYVEKHLEKLGSRPLSSGIDNEDDLFDEIYDTIYNWEDLPQVYKENGEPDMDIIRRWAKEIFDDTFEVWGPIFEID